MGVWTVNMTIQDSEGHKSVCGFYLPDATALADVEDAALQAVTLLDAIILGGIVAVNITKSVDVAGVPTAIGASDVEEGAMFVFVTDGGFYTRMRVPTFDRATHIPTNSDDVTILGAVQNFTGWMSIGAQPGAEPCDYRGDDIAGISTAKESFQRQRR